VSQLHMKGTFHNAGLMRSFGIRPIILVRRIEDIVVSLQHDLKEKRQRRSLGTGRSGYSFVWQDQSTQELSNERLLDMIIDLAVPWFVNFYVSWYRLCEQGAVDALWVTYEELFDDKEKTVQRVLDFLGLRGAAGIEPDILSRKYRTFRDGRVGQGALTLTAEQQRRLRERFSYYPGVDFGKYGI
jgi:Sulfotransferase domain